MQPSSDAILDAPTTGALKVPVPVSVEGRADQRAVAPADARSAHLGRGEVKLLREIPAELRGVWEAGLAGQCCDHRYYELIRESIRGRFEHAYLAVSDAAGVVRAIQPAFVVREDLLAGVPKRLSGVVRALRRVWPGALMLRMLMIGCATGEGSLAAPEGVDAGWVAAALGRALPRLGRELRAPLLVFKDFPSAYRPAMDAPLAAVGFARLASMPASDLALTFKDFEEYLSTQHSRTGRRDLRKKFKAAAAAGTIQMEVLTDITPLVEEAYGLYRQVYERAKLKFEELTPEYLRGLGQRMGDRARFFVWRLDGRMVAFNICMVHGDTIKDHYIGLDYSVALDLHLYFLSWRDIVSWALAQGLRVYWTAPLAYAPKLALRMRLAPLDLYVRHRSRWINPVFRRVVRLFGPTRFDADLKKFPNFAELG